MSLVVEEEAVPQLDSLELHTHHLTERLAHQTSVKHRLRNPAAKQVNVVHVPETTVGRDSAVDVWEQGPDSAVDFSEQGPDSAVDVLEQGPKKQNERSNHLYLSKFQCESP